MAPRATDAAPPPRRKQKKSGRPARDARPALDRDAVIDAALRVFTRRGYEAASIQDIAREAGLSKSSIYHHISSKERLLSLALERAFKSLGAIFERLEGIEGAPVDCLKFAFRQAVLVTLEYHQEVDLLQRIKGNSPVERNALQRRRKVDTLFTELLRAAIHRSQLRDDIDPSLITRLMLGMSNSVTQWYRPDGRLAPEAIADALIAIVFDGLTTASLDRVSTAINNRPTGRSI